MIKYNLCNKCLKNVIEMFIFVCICFLNMCIFWEYFLCMIRIFIYIFCLERDRKNIRERERRRMRERKRERFIFEDCNDFINYEILKM